MTLQEKIMDSFLGKVVRKDLASLVKGGLPVPTYVLEYLLGQYCASDDEDDIEMGLEKVKEVIRNNYVHRAEAEIVKGKIKENGRHRIIDKVSVTLNERSDEYHAQFANLGLTGIPIGAEYVKANPKLLSGNGVWCIITIGHIPGEDVKVRWEIQTLKPVQIANIDLQQYIDQRKKFTTEEWIDFLIHTVGLNPENMNRREKFIVLSRLLPHVENNFNFMELGPKGTGKSHVFQELSPYGVLVSGGDVTPARLFVKMSGNKEILGLVGYWDVVAWDEFEQQKGRSVDAVLIDTMQNYLANKSFNRGKGTHEASASMSFVGNIKHPAPYMLKHSHLFESIPTSFIKGAFLDRIHLYNPGWEIKMLKKDSFSKGYGLITDYVAAVLHAMRNTDLTSLLKNYAQFDKSLTERDSLAIRKTFSGLIKIIYPDQNFTDEEVYELIDFAAESRKRVKDQLYIIDETFKEEPAKFEYLNLKTGQKKQIYTLEQIENDFLPEHERNIEQDNSLPDAEPNNIPNKEDSPQDAPKPERKKQLASGYREIRANQSNVSYKKLFGDYLKTAKHIVITDPYIRAPFQIDNLIEFIQTARECSQFSEEMTIEVHTQNDDEKIPEMIDTFDELQTELEAVGIEFTYAFDADHDRSIRLDNGWKINLSRGLDIFEKFSRFSLGNVRQENRRCREFNITYVPES